MGIEKLVKDAKVIAVICNQYGDTGKGKFSDYFASSWADVTARGTGGNNAGHTVKVNGVEKIFHLIPAGISHDSDGKTTILGNGMVIDLKVLNHELDELEREGNTFDNLMISQDAHVIMPYHVSFDKAKNQSQKCGGIGSTGRGIGPAYTDKIARRGITVGDFLDKDRLAKKIDKVIEFYPNSTAVKEEIIEILGPYFERIRPFVRDTVTEMHKFYRNGKKILLEGAQGLLLSVEYGTHPYVTSSDCSLNGTSTGVGLSAKMVDLPFGIVKFPFMTRVGGGPFPTELGGERSEKYCADERTKIDELKEYGIKYSTKNGGVQYDTRAPGIINMMNSDDEFVQGIGIRLAAGEYGATTGRPRRTGWTDAVAAKYAAGINGPLMILTKADSIAGAKKFKICHGYLGEGGISTEFSRDEKFLRRARPVYSEYQGYGEISDARSYSSLPTSLRIAIKDLEAFTEGRVAIVSVGAERDETIVRD